MRWAWWMTALIFAVIGTVLFFVFRTGKSLIVGDRVLYRGWYIGYIKPIEGYHSYAPTTERAYGYTTSDKLEQQDKTWFDWFYSVGGWAHPESLGYIKA